MKTFLLLLFFGAVSMPFMGQWTQIPSNPISYNALTETDKETEPSTDLEAYETETVIFTETYTPKEEDILKMIPEFVITPEGGLSWDVFGETKQHEHVVESDDEFDWTVLRPEFSENLKKLDGQIILMQGYMFPLSPEEKQPIFLFGPFPVSCPYHYHLPPKLIIEVSSTTPVSFSYDAINIKGTLELVPRDDEYNIFYRIKNAELVL